MPIKVCIDKTISPSAPISEKSNFVFRKDDRAVSSEAGPKKSGETLIALPFAGEMILHAKSGGSAAQ